MKYFLILLTKKLHLLVESTYRKKTKKHLVFSFLKNKFAIMLNTAQHSLSSYFSLFLSLYNRHLSPVEAISKFHYFLFTKRLIALCLFAFMAFNSNSQSFHIKKGTKVSGLKNLTLKPTANHQSTTTSLKATKTLFIGQHTKVTGLSHINKAQPKTTRLKITKVKKRSSATIFAKTKETEKAYQSKFIIALPFGNLPTQSIGVCSRNVAISINSKDKKTSKKVPVIPSLLRNLKQIQITNNHLVNNTPYLHKKLKAPFGGLGGIRPPPKTT